MSAEAPSTVPRSTWLGFFFPLILSAFFFVSGVFALFSPLPLVWVSLARGRWLGFAALLTNAAVVWALSGAGKAGGLSALGYLVAVGPIGLSMGLFLRKRWSPERIVGWTWACAVGALLAALLIHAALDHVSIATEFRHQANRFLDQFASQLTPETRAQIVGEGGDLEDWKQKMMVEIPSGIATVILIAIWANLAMVVRLNPDDLWTKLGWGPRVLQSWRTPPAFAWIVVALWAVFLFGTGPWSTWSISIFKFFMAAYAIQGLAVLSTLLDAWGVFGLFRMILFFAAVFLMMPLVLSVGFFDLWFDFRAKFRQS